MRLALVVLALVGCKFRFDERADAQRADAPVMIDVPPDHDEDGDGVVDVIDTCPHLAVPQTDTDGDGVGDACDPAPGAPTERIAMFDPFLNASGWTAITGTWLPQGDALRCASDETVYCELMADEAFFLGEVELGVDVVSRDATAAQHQITIATNVTNAMAYYYVEAYEFNTSAGYAALSHHDGAGNYTPIAQLPMMTGVHPGSVRLGLNAPTPSTVGIRVEWSGETYTPGAGGLLDYTGGTTIRFGATGVVVDLRYAIVIKTN